MTTDFMVVNIDPTGTVRAMHRDEFNLGFLGKQEIKRASEIKFDEGNQLWDIYIPPKDGLPVEQWHTFIYIRGFSTYKKARDFEVLWLEHCALECIVPLSSCGMELAEKLRRDYGDFDNVIAKALGVTTGAKK